MTMPVQAEAGPEKRMKAIAAVKTRAGKEKRSFCITASFWGEKTFL
jgi:hypothetical protein